MKTIYLQFPSVCTVCAARYGSNDYDITSCAPCGVGTFKARAELTSSEPCGPRTKNTQEGSTSCDGESYQFVFYEMLQCRNRFVTDPVVISFS